MTHELGNQLSLDQQGFDRLYLPLLAWHADERPREITDIADEVGPDQRAFLSVTEGPQGLTVHREDHFLRSKSSPGQEMSDGSVTTLEVVEGLLVVSFGRRYVTQGDKGEHLTRVAPQPLKAERARRLRFNTVAGPVLEIVRLQEERFRR